MANLARLFRSAILASVAACGSPDGLGPPGGTQDMGSDFGFVGSGGYGHLDGGAFPGEVGGGSGIRDGGIAARDAGGSRGSDGGGGGGPALDAGGNEGAADEDANGDLDGGSGVGVVVSTPAGLFVFLDWSISGPHGPYSGRVYFGDAHSIEFVAGGIQAGSGYTITLTGTDRDGQQCSGTSAPFAVMAGLLTGAPVVITCPSRIDPADVTTGTVSVDASVVINDL